VEHSINFNDKSLSQLIVLVSDLLVLVSGHQDVFFNAMLLAIVNQLGAW